MDVLRVAIMDPSDATRDPLRNLLLGIESVWLEAECARYEFFADVCRQSNPDLVVISIDSDQNKALQLIQQINIEHPGLPILALSARGDGQVILKALRNGAKEFLTAPVVMEELLEALQRLRQSRYSSEPGSTVSPVNTSSTVISIIGSRGGVGCTSIAVNLGCNLAHDTNHNVALVDLDLALGDADVALDLIPDYTLTDVALAVDRLDMTFLRRSLCQHSSGLSVLPHPVQMEEIAQIHEDHLHRVIGLMRASYSMLLLDLSKSVNATDYTAMCLSDVILLVAQLDLTSLRNVVRMLHAFGQDENLRDKIRVVMNRVGSEECEITLKKAEETIGQPIFWQIPNDFKNMLGARNAGVPLLEHSPRSKAQLSLQGLARELCGNTDGDKSAPKPAGKSGLRSLFSFK